MKKRGNIAKRTLINVFVTVLVLVVTISVSTGLQMRSVLIEKYTDFALSYVRAAAEFIDGDTVRKYYETGIKDDYYEEIRKYLNSTADSSAKNANIRYFYVLIPENEEIYTYIWDAEPYDEPMDLLEQYPFSEGAEEQAEKIFRKEISEDSQYYIDAEDGTPTLTVSVPLLDSDENVVAIIAADLSVIGINNAIIRIIVSMLAPVLTVMLITMISYYYIIRKRIIRPIIKLQGATEEIIDCIDSDELVKIDIHTNDEIEMLADSFSGMSEKLRDYIKQNAAITAEKERIGAELELAKRIQEDMLPNIFPAFPDREDFDIYASMTPAKEVGGDFYDFFLVDNNHLALVMADVSGKGIPAALFMMMSKILIQNQVINGKSPAEAIETVNNQICANNREEMFVTVWLGILNLKTGLLTATNAGHEKPIIKKPDGNFEIYSDRHGFIVGGMEGMKYKEYQIQMEKHSKLFIYTDGVMEATNEDDELFGANNTLAVLNDIKDKTPDVILKTVKKRVDEFVGTAPQFDDLTMLCLEYNGQGDITDDEEITVDAEVSEISAVTEFVGERIQDLPFSLKEKNLIEIAVDEIMSNIANYAYGDDRGKAYVLFNSNESGITLTFRDRGIPYNPLEKPDPDITLPVEARKIGGNGILIVKRIMDNVEYERTDGFNILKLYKNYSELS